MSREQIFVLLFCNLLSMQYHPGFTKGARRLDVDEMLDICEDATARVEDRVKEFS